VLSPVNRHLKVCRWISATPTTPVTCLFLDTQAGGVKPEEIEKPLEGTDEEKKRTIMKIIRAVMR
jgi:hypothetical protein